MEHQLRELAGRIRTAQRVTVMTGAGVSAASGVPTFRGPEGLWRSFRPEDLATLEAFARDPELVWEWYGWRRATVAACHPNAAHDVLARWSRDELKHVRVITQNVDDLHRLAGTRDLIRLHGSLWEVKCFNSCARGTRAWRDERVPLPDRVPPCPYCSGPARPAVVWFGEGLDAADVGRASEAAACDLFLAVGTSAIVYPAAGFLQLAQSHGAFTAEINLEPTPASSRVDLSILGAAERVLPAIDQLLSSFRLPQV
jgi:NAD-dependent protein deacetylase/lipoamidase